MATYNTTLDIIVSSEIAMGWEEKFRRWNFSLISIATKYQILFVEFDVCTFTRKLFR